jgi:hypothetical protein
MQKLIWRIQLAIGILLILIANTFGQDECVSQGWLSNSLYSIKLVPVCRQIDSLFILVMNSQNYSIFTKGPSHNWDLLCSQNQPQDHSSLLEVSVNHSGSPFVYNLITDSCYWFSDGIWNGRPCPGRPLLDSLDNIHIIWKNNADTAHIFYGYSTDTLRTFADIDTLPSFHQVFYLISSPGKSKIAAVLVDLVDTMLVRYQSVCGQPFDFTASPDTFNCGYAASHLYDITLDDDGKLYFATSFYVNGLWRSHYVWSEEYGYRYLSDSLDQFRYSTGFEFCFGPNDGEIVLIKCGPPPSGYSDACFLVTTDGGNTWNRSTFSNPFVFRRYYGSAPRRYSNIIDYTYYTYSTGENVYYYPIPRDSIFNNLTAIDGGETPLPEDISLSNYPNPFNASTIVSFNMPQAGYVRLEIFDITGRLIANLLDGFKRAGSHSIIWDSKDMAGHQVSSGVYFYRLNIQGGSSVTKEMLLLK